MDKIFISHHFTFLESLFYFPFLNCPPLNAKDVPFDWSSPSSSFGIPHLIIPFYNPPSYGSTESSFLVSFSPSSILHSSSQPTTPSNNTLLPTTSFGSTSLHDESHVPTLLSTQLEAHVHSVGTLHASNPIERPIASPISYPRLKSRTHAMHLGIE